VFQSIGPSKIKQEQEQSGTSKDDEPVNTNESAAWRDWMNVQ
jgi:hypothetical protein